MPIDVIYMLLALIKRQIDLAVFSLNKEKNIRLRSTVSECIEKVRKSVLRNKSRFSWHDVIMRNQQSYFDTTNNR